MKYISSKENIIFKRAIKLTRKKFRDETGMYLLEGVKPLRDALQMGSPIETIFVCDEKMEEIRQEFTGSDVSVVGLSRELFYELSDTENSQGIISVIRRENLSASDFAARTAPGANVIILDCLQDPGNAGTIIRTAEAAGYAGIIVMKGSCDIYSPKVVRAAAGSLLRVPTVTGWGIDQLKKYISDSGKKLTVTCLEKAVNCFQEDLSENIALVIGNEGQGVSQELMDIADIRIRIPMAGAIESLNAAVAAGILMYQSAGGKYSCRIS